MQQKRTIKIHELSITAYGKKHAFVFKRLREQLENICKEKNTQKGTQAFWEKNKDNFQNRIIIIKLKIQRIILTAQETKLEEQ